MREPLMRTEHACDMPSKISRYIHQVYVCSCGCGWRAVIDPRFDSLVWTWEQVF
jgi:hypothetical protein